MAAYAHLGNNIFVGLTTDTKPTAANTANGAICIEWATNYATFTLYVNNQTTWLPQTEFTETQKNKTLDSSNTISSATSLPTVTVAKGGTGATTLTGILLGNGTSAVTASNTLAGITLTTPIVNGIKGGDVAITNTDSPYTALATSRIIRADATSGAITINLPTAVGIAGFEYHIFRTDIIASTNLITIDANSTETIDSNLTYILFPAEYVKLESDGANWQVISRPTVTTHGYFFAKGSTLNRRYMGGMGNNAIANPTSTTSPAANLLWALAFIVGKTTKFDTIGFNQTTASTSGNSHVGIYRDNGNCYPGALIFDSGDIATGSGTGERAVTITSSLQVFQPGLYWLAYEQDTNTGQMRILPTTSVVMSVYGTDANLGSGGATQGWHYNVAHTFGALPNPYTAAATLSTVASAAATPIPAVGMRAI
jgi:hypothetical protein